MEFRADRTVSVRSGALQLTAVYRAESRADGLLLVQDSLRTNGEPNCQGIPADYVVHNYFRRAFIELKGDTLRMYTTEQRTGAVFTLVRSH